MKIHAYPFRERFAHWESSWIRHIYASFSFPGGHPITQLFHAEKCQKVLVIPKPTGSYFEILRTEFCRQMLLGCHRMPTVNGNAWYLQHLHNEKNPQTSSEVNQQICLLGKWTLSVLGESPSWSHISAGLPSRFCVQSFGACTECMFWIKPGGMQKNIAWNWVVPWRYLQRSIVLSANCACKHMNWVLINEIYSGYHSTH